LIAAAIAATPSAATEGAPMSTPKHTEDKAGIALAVFMPTMIVALWIFLCVLGISVH
jgi:hypothetical protein